MTQVAQLPRAVWIGTGGRGPFTIQDENGVAIHIPTDADVTVERYDSVTDTSPTLLVNGTDYTLSGLPSAPAITLTSSQAVLTSSERILITRVSGKTQDLDLISGGDYSAESLEARLDEHLRMIQEIHLLASRSIRQFGLETTGLVLPPVATRASKYSGWDSEGKVTALELVNVGQTLTLGSGWPEHLAQPLLSDEYIIVDTLSELANLQGAEPEDIVEVLGRTAAGDGYAGRFRWVSGDQSANVTADPNQGIWVAPATVSTGASGAWKRMYDETRTKPEWFGTSADWPSAIAAASNALPSGTGGDVELTQKLYTCATAITITADHTRLIGNGRWATEIRFTSTTNNGIKFNTGEAAIGNNMIAENFFITSTVVQTAGVAIRFDNVLFAQVRNIRIFGDSKIWQALQFYSCTKSRIDDMEVADVQRQFLKVYGGSNTPSAVNGRNQDITFNGFNYFYGCQTGNGSAALGVDAGFEFGEYVEGVYNSGTLIGGKPVSGSTLLLIKGNGTNKSNAFEFGQLELEAAAGAEGLYAENAIDIAIDRGWLGGNNAVGVEFASSCSDIVIGENVEIYADGTTPSTACIVACPNFTSRARLVDYNGTTHTGYSVDHSTATDAFIGGSVSSFATGVSGTSVGVQTRFCLEIDFGEGCTTDLSGYDTASAGRMNNNSRQGPCTHKLTGGSKLLNDNGDFSQWQRGTNYTTLATRIYVSDRWNALRASSTNNCTISRQTGSNGYCIRVQRDSGTSDTADIYLVHDVKSAKLEALQAAGRRVVLRFRARKGANLSTVGDQLLLQITEGQGTNEALLNGYTSSNVVVNQPTITLTTSWQSFKISFDLASSSTGLGVNFIHRGVGTAGAADYFEIEQVEFCDPLALAPVYDARLPHDEEDNCRRYYQSATKRARNGEEYIDFIPRMAGAPTVAVGVGSSGSVSADGFLSTHNAAADLSYTATLEP